MIYPNFLKEGKIGITALSMGVDEAKKDSFNVSLDYLKSRGINTYCTKNVYSNNKVVSSQKKKRAKEFNELITKKDIDIIMCARGGDILFDCLKYIDFNVLKQNPKWVEGYSDPTSLLFTITTKYDIATIYGNNAGSFDESHKCYDNNIEILKGNIKNQNNFKTYENDWQLINKEFKEDGILIGGCIECLRYIIGTKFDNVNAFIEKYKDYGFIWYFDIFDITSYDLYNTLIQFKNSGWFKNTKAFIFGRVLIDNSTKEFSYKKAIKKALGNKNIVINADIGHVRPTFTIINGALGTINITNNNAKLKMKLIKD